MTLHVCNRGLRPFAAGLVLAVLGPAAVSATATASSQLTSTFRIVEVRDAGGTVLGSFPAGFTFSTGMEVADQTTLVSEGVGNVVFNGTASSTDAGVDSTITHSPDLGCTASAGGEHSASESVINRWVWSNQSGQAITVRVEFSETYALTATIDNLAEAGTVVSSYSAVAFPAGWTISGETTCPSFVFSLTSNSVQVERAVFSAVGGASDAAGPLVCQFDVTVPDMESSDPGNDNYSSGAFCTAVSPIAVPALPRGALLLLVLLLAATGAWIVRRQARAG